MIGYEVAGAIPCGARDIVIRDISPHAVIGTIQKP